MAARTVPLLDDDQQAAVAHRDGPCLVLAGPGSGKTRVIAERFVRLADGGVAPEQQLVLTYTHRAATEMRERVEAALGLLATPPLMTFHAFAQRVLRTWGWRVGVPPSFRVANDAERWLHLEAVLEEQRPRTLYNPLRPHEYVHALLKLFETAKQELVTPERYAAWAERRAAEESDPAELALLERHAEAASLYAGLERRYRNRAVLDHDDTILLTFQLLDHDPAVQHAVAGAVTHVMVDEYQDTNHAQARLLEALVRRHRNLLVVADDDQAIYKFRGASLANLDRFAREFPDHRIVRLSSNYRSTPEIVGVARALMQDAAAESRIPKQVRSRRDDGAPVEVWEAADGRSEALAVATELRRLIESEEVAPSDCAWLFRRHAHMEPAIDALRELGVPYRVRGGRGYFQQHDVKDVLALLAAVADPGDVQALLRCLHAPAWHVSAAGRRALVAAHRDELPLHRQVLEGTVAGLAPSDLEAARRCVACIVDLHARAERDDVRELFAEALERSDFLGILDHRTELARLQSGANLNKLGELLEDFADWSDDRRVATALRYLHVLRDSGAADDLPPVDAGVEGVELLTAHGSKGLEWPVVVLNGCVESRWPGTGGFPDRLTLPDELVPEPPPPGDRMVDEERRIFHVAATRARDRLVLTRARRYRTSFTDERPSPFLVALHARVRTLAVRRVEDAPAPPRRRGAGVAEARHGRLRVSVSDLRTYRECARRYEYRVRYRMPTPQSLQAWYGVLVHGVLHEAASLRLAGQACADADVLAMYAAAWRAARPPAGATAELREHGAEQLRRYLASPAWRDGRIVAAESSFAVALDRADLEGRFDRVDEDGVVVDYKTGPPRTAAQLQRDLQVRAYAVALSQQRGSDSVAVELHHLQTAEVTRVEAGAEALGKWHFQLRKVSDEVADAWVRGEFPPSPSAYRCARCEYRTICDEGRRAAE